jgi:hypothetical protein
MLSAKMEEDKDQASDLQFILERPQYSYLWEGCYKPRTMPSVKCLVFVNLGIAMLKSEVWSPNSCFCSAHFRGIHGSSCDYSNLTSTICNTAFVSQQLCKAQHTDVLSLYTEFVIWAVEPASG